MESTGLRYPGSIRIAAALSLVLLFVAAAIQFAPEPQPLRVQKRQAPMSIRQYIDEVDSDRDGLPDWQEFLIGTNPNNSDSDGDGVPDAVKNAAALSLRDVFATTSTTLTDVVGLRLFNEYTTLKERGLYTEKQAGELGEKLARGIRPDITFTTYTADDLIVRDDVSAGAVEAHREALKEAVAPFFNLSEPEFAIYGQFVESGDAALLKKLAEHAAVYREVLESVRHTPVPKNMVHIHLEVVNSLSLFASVLDSMVKEADNPLASYALIHIYSESEKYLEAAFSALAREYRTRLFKADSNQLSVL